MSEPDSSLLERFRALRQQAETARADLLSTSARAAPAVYDLRLSLRIFRIIQRFVRKDSRVIAVSSQLDHCYRATSTVRDHQVGIALICQLEQGWPRNRRRPSTTLRRQLPLAYRDLARQVDALGLPRVLHVFDRAFVALTSSIPEARLRERALKHARRLRRVVLRRLRQAEERQRARDWHALRLAIKQYRFWLSTLEDWLPLSYSVDVKQLKPLQVALGDYHDWVVLETWLGELPEVPLDRWLPLVQSHQQAALQGALSYTARLAVLHGTSSA